MGRKSRQSANQRWYWVACGRQCGVFQGWSTVASLVTGYPGAHFAYCSTQQEAQLCYRQAIGHHPPTTEMPPTEQPGPEPYVPEPQQPPVQPPEQCQRDREPGSTVREQRLAELRKRRHNQEDSNVKPKKIAKKQETTA